jgi:hypothetical protein
MIISDAKVKQMEISAVITRADGSVEDLGTIQYWNKNPLKRIIWRIKKWLHF